MTQIRHSWRDRTTDYAVMLRALFLYLILVWMMTRFVAVDQQGKAHLAFVAAAILLGFPIAAGVARLLHRRPPAILAGSWRIAFAAVATALVLPITCLRMTGAGGPMQSTLNATDHQIVPAAVVRELTAADDFGGLRLRIRGLSVAAHRAAPAELHTGLVTLFLDTSLHETGVGRRALIEVRLVEEVGDKVLWRDEYVADPEDVPALRRVLIRALTEGMSRTREGMVEGQLI